MDPKSTSDAILAQILSCLDAATSRPGLVKASVHQTEGYLRGLQGLDWEKPTSPPPPSNDAAAVFLHDVRGGLIALRGRIKNDAEQSAGQFIEGLQSTFPEADKKPFAGALSRLWVRWKSHQSENARDVGGQIGVILKAEYEEGVAGELSANILSDRLHLRNTRDYLRMRGWLQGRIEHLRRKSDWESRECASLLEGNFSSIVLRALHNANVDYAASAVAKLPSMMAQLDRAIANLAATEPEASHFLRKNRATVLTRALHSGYFDYPQEAANDLPRTLRDLYSRIGELETSSPEAARDLRSNISSLIYRALTNGKLTAL